MGFVQNMYSGEEGSNVTICAELIDGTLQRDVFAMVEFANVSALEGIYECILICTFYVFSF